MKKILLVALMLVTATPVFALSTKPGKPDFNPKYQTSTVSTCKSNGHPNFIIDANGQKVPNPLVQGYRRVWYQGYLFRSGICDYKNNGSSVDPWVDPLAAPICFDPEKIEYYTCTFNE